MKVTRPTNLGIGLQKFFHDYLPKLRGLSPRTTQSYRDSIVLLLKFLATHQSKTVDHLDLDDLTAETITQFLNDLESQRNNSISTRNARLAGAMHTLTRFLAGLHPQNMAALQAILNLPFKRGTTSVPIEYVEENEVQALLASIDRRTISGRRDYALFALMFNIGARVQEIIDLRFLDLRLEPPCQVRLSGKGNKVRICPIWPQTARLLRDLRDEAHAGEKSDSPVFVNRHGGRLTRFGVRYLLRKHIKAACRDIPILESKRIHPHSLRHSTAVHLLKAGVDFATISHWLGHASLDTTMRYARSDLDLKRQALSQVFPEVLGVSSRRKDPLPEASLFEWLRGL